MITSITDWLVFLRISNMLVVLPLLLGGVALMVFGWRFWKGCVVLSFGLVGMGVGTYLFSDNSMQPLPAIACGLALAILSYWPVNYSLALLGGGVGAAFLYNTLAGMGITGPVLWITGGIAMFGCTALAFINRQLVVIGVTSFLGAVLVVSGLTAFVMNQSTLYATLASHSAFLVPFALIVPTVMSCFFQVAEVHRTNSNM